MNGTINRACETGDIKIHWTDKVVWFDFGDATSREKKKLIKFITAGRKQNQFDAFLADDEGKPYGEQLKSFPKGHQRIALKRKPFEIKGLIEKFVDEKIKSLDCLVFEMKGKGKGKLLRAGEFKVKSDEQLKKEGAEKQEVVETKRPSGG